MAWCAARPDPASQAQVIALVQALYYFLGVRGYWREKLEFGAKALQAAETLGDRASQAQLHVRVIGWTHLQLSQFEPARAHLQRGLELYQQLGDPGGLASSYRYLATLERRGGGEAGRAAAAELYQQALQAADQVADSGRLRASVLISLSTLTVKTGRWAEAEGHLRAALATFRKLGHTSKIAEVLSRLGDLCVLQARLDEAAALFAESQSYAAAITRQKTIAYNLLGLARIAQKRGDYQQMRALALQARQAFGNLAIADESQEIQDLAQMLPAEPA